jgi:hypothetical protein
VSQPKACPSRVFGNLAVWQWSLCFKAYPSSIPTKPQTSSFSYQDKDGGSPLLSDAGSRVLLATLKDVEVGCFMCLKIVQCSKIWDHLAKHILPPLYHQPQKDLKISVGEDNPCGSCGCSGTRTIDITKKNSMESPQSNCPNYYKFLMKTCWNMMMNNPTSCRYNRCYRSVVSS